MLHVNGAGVTHVQVMLHVNGAGVTHVQVMLHVNGARVTNKVKVCKKIRYWKDSIDRNKKVS